MQEDQLNHLQRLQLKGSPRTFCTHTKDVLTKNIKVQQTHLKSRCKTIFFLLRAPFGQYGPVAAFELYLYTAVDSRPGPGGSRTTASCQP